MLSSASSRGIGHDNGAGDGHGPVVGFGADGDIRWRWIESVRHAVIPFPTMSYESGCGTGATKVRRVSTAFQSGFQRLTNVGRRVRHGDPRLFQGRDLG